MYLQSEWKDQYGEPAAYKWLKSRSDITMDIKPAESTALHAYRNEIHLLTGFYQQILTQVWRIANH